MQQEKTNFIKKLLPKNKPDMEAYDAKPESGAVIALPRKRAGSGDEDELEQFEPKNKKKSSNKRSKH